eukprot:12353601-Alexandrium_andersonii.AAC.1
MFDDVGNKLGSRGPEAPALGVRKVRRGGKGGEVFPYPMVGFGVRVSQDNTSVGIAVWGHVDTF